MFFFLQIFENAVFWASPKTRLAPETTQPMLLLCLTICSHWEFHIEYCTYTNSSNKIYSHIKLPSNVPIQKKYLDKETNKCHKNINEIFWINVSKVQTVVMRETDIKEREREGDIKVLPDDRKLCSQVHFSWGLIPQNTPYFLLSGKLWRGWSKLAHYQLAKSSILKKKEINS